MSKSVAAAPHARRGSAEAPLVCLVGAPNCGKSSLFNLLTGRHAEVGNRAGVTVSPAVAPLSGSFGFSALLSDIPGVTSFVPSGRDEEAALSHLFAAAPAVILHILDATALKDQLPLTLHIAELCRLRSCPLIVGVTMVDLLEKQGGKLEVSVLSRALGAPVFPLILTKKQGIVPLMDCLREKLTAAEHRPPSLSVPDTPEGRAEWISSLCARAVSRVPIGARSRRLARLDRAISDSPAAFPVFGCVMALLMYVTFGHPGNFLCDLLSSLLERASGRICAAIPSAAPLWLSLLTEGICEGGAVVFSFFPRIFLLTLCLSALEDCGYLARAAKITDPFMRRFGLDGRACVSFLLGVGCTVPAVMSCRSMYDCRERRLCCTVLPLISCSARIPVYSLLAGSFFGSCGWLIALGIHLLGFVVLLLVCTVAYRRQGGHPFCHPPALPPLRGVNPAAALGRAVREAGGFLRRAGVVIFGVTLLLGLVLHFSPSLRPCAPGDSIPAALGRRICFLLAPIGLNRWEIATALLCGIGAKEATISALALLAPAAVPGTFFAAALFTPASMLSFLTFFSMYCPCAASLITLRRELGAGRTLLCVLVNFCCAWTCALAVFRLVSLWG